MFSIKKCQDCQAYAIVCQVHVCYLILHNKNSQKNMIFYIRSNVNNPVELQDDIRHS